MSDVKAASWTMASRFVAQGAQFLIFLVAARYLTQEQFGVYVLIAAVNMLMMKVAEAGWREFIIAWRGDPQADEQAFGLANAYSFLLMLVGLAMAAVCMQIPSLAEYAGLQALLALSLAFRGLFSVQSGFLIRTQRADVMGKAVLVAQAIHGVVTIYGFIAGWGLMALGWGKLVIQVVSVAYMQWGMRDSPRWRLTGPGGKEIRQYSMSLLSTNLISFSQANAATFVLGLFLGPAAVGLYRAAARVVGSIGDVLGEPLRVICWMSLTRARDEARVGDESEREVAEREGLRKGSIRFIRLSLAMTTPVFIGLWLTSEPFITVLLGDRWAGAAPVAGILALARWAATPAILTAPLLSLARGVDKIPRIQIVSGIIAVIALPIFAPFGIVWAALSELLAAALGTLIHIRAHREFGSVRWLDGLLRSSPTTLASLGMVIALLGSRFWLHGSPWSIEMQLLVELAVALLVYVPVFAAFGGLRQLLSLRQSTRGQQPG